MSIDHNQLHVRVRMIELYMHENTVCLTLHRQTYMLSFWRLRATTLPAGQSILNIYIVVRRAFLIKRRFVSAGCLEIVTSQATATTLRYHWCAVVSSSSSNRIKTQRQAATGTRRPWMLLQSLPTPIKSRVDIAIATEINISSRLRACQQVQ